MQNVVHAFSIVETSPDTSNSLSFVDFVQNYDVFLFRLLYFDVIFTALCVQNVVHAFSSVETIPDTRKSQSFVDFAAN